MGKGLRAGRPPGHPRLITLTTCSKILHADSRMIAFGHLVKVVDERASPGGVASAACP
jgi:sortase (surface protein transpeptidase)